MIKNKFKITGMHCTSCAFNIDGELEDTDGIEEANTSFAKAQTEVKFDPEKVSVDKIIKLIKTVGYTATLA
jgi:copper chaperone CopZ